MSSMSAMMLRADHMLPVYHAAALAPSTRAQAV